MHAWSFLPVFSSYSTRVLSSSIHYHLTLSCSVRKTIARSKIYVVNLVHRGRLNVYEHNPLHIRGVCLCVFFCRRPFSIYFSRILFIEIWQSVLHCVYAKFKLGFFFCNFWHDVIIYRNSISICVCGKFGFVSQREFWKAAPSIENDRTKVSSSLHDRSKSVLLERLPIAFRENTIKSLPCIPYFLLYIIHAQFLLLARRDFRP